MNLSFEDIKQFLESWGLHYDTFLEVSSDIPYPQIYERMKEDAGRVGGEKFQKFVSQITDTTDSQTYLTPDSWEEIRQAWELFS